MPSTDVFEEQDEHYKSSVLPMSIDKRIAIEAGVTHYWRKYVGLTGKVIGLNAFGESAPAKDVFSHFGFSVDKIIETIESVLDG